MGDLESEDSLFLLSIAPANGSIATYSDGVLFRPVSVLGTCFTKQTGDMVCTMAENSWLPSFGLTHEDAFMPWKETRTVDQRLQFLSSYQRETPGSIYVPSTRLLPSRVASFQYPRSFQTRRVNNSGDISWHEGRVFVSEVFRNEEIGLEQMDEDVHRVFFWNTELGEFNSAEMRFRPALRP